ncbi:MAG TPA: hypothetical protein VK589_11875 [Chryseolinea sp.]|nr:hypothetical protein [Chryseolinea sp.]
MPKTIVSGNLNQFGNAGQFETDRSTWGFADGAYTVVRSSAQQTAGLYAAFVTKSATGDTLLLPCRWFSELGKKYLLKAKVRVPTATPPATDGINITLLSDLNNLTLAQTEIERVDKTVLEAKDAWVDIEISFEHTNALFPTLNEVCHIHVDGSPILNGQIYVDEFEVYEYVGTSDPEPEPEPEPPDETDVASLSKNPITLGKAAAVDWESATNYRLYNDVRVEDVADSGTYNSKLKLELPPDADGNVVFYLNEAFKDALTTVPPTLNQNTIVRLTDRIKRFKCFTGELINDEVTPGDLDESTANLVLFGGIAKFSWPTLDYLNTYLPTNKKFLTWAPIQKYVDRLQEDYLNFWNYSEDITELKLQIKAYFDDNTDETAVTTNLSPVTYRSLYQIPAGPVNSGATLVNPAKNLTRYELSLLDQDDNVISEVRSYFITIVRHPLTRFFMFLNSLGSFEVLRFTGQADKQTDFSRELVQKFLPHNYAAVDGEFELNNNIIQPKHNYSSGFIKGTMAKAWHEYMQDFLNTSRLYDVTDGRRIPLNIIGGNWSEADQNYDRFIRFDVKPAYEDQSFTPSSI